MKVYSFLAITFLLAGCLSEHNSIPKSKPIVNDAEVEASDPTASDDSSSDGDVDVEPQPADPLVVADGERLIFYDDAENHPDTEWGAPLTEKWNYWSGGDHNPMNFNQNSSMRRVAQGFEGAPAPRAGNYSYRAQIIKDESYPECCNHLRSEMYFGGGGQAYIGWEWAAVSQYIPNDWCEDVNRIGVGFDSKFANSIGPASFFLMIEDGQYAAYRQWPQGSSDVRTFLGKVEKGKWVDWILHRNFKDDSTGFMELYKDGKLVWSHKGGNYMMDNGPQTEGYLLQGLYKWPWATPNGQGEGPSICKKFTIYMDEFRFGGKTATLNDFLIPR